PGFVPEVVAGPEGATVLRAHLPDPRRTRCLKQQPRTPAATLSPSLLPPDLVPKHNTAGDRDPCAGTGRHLHFRDPPLDGDVYGGLPAVVAFRECHDRPVRHRVAAAVSHRVSLQLNLLSGRMS